MGLVYKSYKSRTHASHCSHELFVWYFMSKIKKMRKELRGAKSLRRRILGRSKKSCDDDIQQSLVELKFGKVDGIKMFLCTSQ
jgi:hypothetical protein